ncbi:signal peptide peptidase SppA [Chondrinema litorale]|uniref:signal peptide peptidase SppA n=1 Tax=Chondrinema litorale TaxID=2994555 RepID=UPI002543E3FE|nr:signal peptide peptidase SppA [Chondrinema litorale]UZR95117.1 signal peptide peptidase SppA [Chondrinema litorale]
MRFLGNVLATVIGLIVFVLLLIFGSIFLVTAISSQSQEVVKIEQNSILKLTLDRPIQERIEEENPFDDLDIFPGMSPVPLGLIELKGEIENASLDPDIEGIYLELSVVSAGFATLEELRNSLIKFKESDKFIVAYGEYYSEGAYYLASIADEVYLNPAGLMEFDGLSTEIVYYKEFLNNIGIEPEIFRVGEYKSAVEPFLRNDMSPENRYQIQEYMGDLHQHYLEKVAEAREIDLPTITEISDNALIRKPGDAVKYNLVTDTVYYDQVLSILKARVGAGDDGLNLISYKKYTKSTRYNRQDFSSNKVAVIVAEGQIISGEGGSGFLGGNKIAAEIRKARNNESIKAIVLRINSPGGSALASDVMWREVKLAAEVKPVIASMSDVAASGGYYMAMAADTIVAYPNTITGSIGIFALLFNAEDLLTNKIGLNFETVSTGKFSNLASPTERFSEAERQYLQQSVERGYESFVGKAAAGRNLSIDSLKSLASGRVWTGSDAVERGLVDFEGGIGDAIRIAAESAGLGDDYMVRYYPEKKDFLTELLNNPMDQVNSMFYSDEQKLLAPLVKQMEKLNAMEGTQVLLPFQVNSFE